MRVSTLTMRTILILNDIQVLNTLNKLMIQKNFQKKFENNQRTPKTLL